MLVDATPDWKLCVLSTQNKYPHTYMYVRRSVFKRDQKPWGRAKEGPY